MFKLFKRKPSPPSPEPIFRGCLPTYVTDDALVLSKVAPSIRNSYEIRLALYMAKLKGLNFVLAVPLETEVDSAVQSLLKDHGGSIQTASLNDYSVYFGRVAPNGDEEGWVLGNSESFRMLRNAIRLPLLQDRLTIGSVIFAGEAAQIESEIMKENFQLTNIDGEEFRNALLTLLEDTRINGGLVFVQ